MKNNPILESLQENDIVMIELPSTERSDVKQICRIFNLNFTKSDNEKDIDWLDFDGEILYTNIKLHKTMLDYPLGNCMAITEHINADQLEQIARVNDMWKTDMYLMSDAEFEYKKNLLSLTHNHK